MAFLLKNKQRQRWMFTALACAFIIPSIVAIFIKFPGTGSSLVSVNGKVLSANEFKAEVANIQSRVQSVMQYLPNLNFSQDMMLNMILGGRSIEEVALDNAIKNELTRQALDTMHIVIDEHEFKESLIQTLPPQVFDATGHINIKEYEQLLSRMQMTPADFEKRAYNDSRKDILFKVLAAADYSPRYEQEYYQKNDSGKKSFIVARFELSHFIQEEKNATVERSALINFFDKHKSNYKVAEKRAVSYCSIAAQGNAKAVTVAASDIAAYYEKNKTSQFRIAPKVAVRRILVSNAQGDAVARKKAEDIMTLVQEDHSQFASLAKQYSADKETAKNGGLVATFSRGTHDPEFEKVAFSLQQKGDISGIVKTAKGYEIVQLEERVAAVEKTLDEVRSQIVSILQAKKSSEAIKEDLEQFIKGSDEVAVFAKKFGSKVENSELCSRGQAGKDGLLGKVLEKAFARGVSRGKKGYFSAEGNFIVYEVTDVQESYVPELKAIESDVISDYKKEVALNNLNAQVKKIKTAILQDKQALKTLDVKTFETGLFSAASKSDKLKDFGVLQTKLFELGSTDQIVEYKHKDDVFVGQLLQHVLPSDEKNEELVQDVKKYAARVKTHVTNAFIASLERTATIDGKKQQKSGYEQE